MQVRVEDLSSVKKVMHIEIPEEDVVQELENAYEDLRKKAKIKGFRKGKVPRSVLERMFRKDVHADVSYKLIQESFVEALRETDINFIGTPDMDTPELETRAPYKYSATVEIRPEIKPIDFKGLELKKTQYEVADAEVETQLKALQRNMAQVNSIQDDRPVQDEDFVLIDYEGYKDGKPFADMPGAKGVTMKIGSAFVHKEFDEQLVGMTPGDSKEFSVHFPETYHNDKLADQDIEFHVTLSEIREEVLPDIDDDFPKAFGDFENLDAFKQEITKNLAAKNENRAQEELKNQIFDALIKKTEFELPETLVNFELDAIIEELQRSFVTQNASLEELGLTRENLAGKYRDVAENNVRRHLLIDRIIDQENVEVTSEDLEEAYRETAEAYKRPLDEIKKYYQGHEENLEFMKRSLLEKKAIRLIVDNSFIENVSLEKSETSEE